ncbi:MAG TPA: hypothetical protein VJN92_04265 [Candidatus Acidoferrum sp.]|nr:hypothetical protein [Candidatus Acidoferrum sp.]
MIGTTGALLAAAALVLFLIAWIRTDRALRDLPFGSKEWPPSLDESGELEACPPEFVSQIFSKRDLAYIERLDSRELEQHFHHERNGVALLWVRHTAEAVDRIMRRHVEASRRSQDIEFVTEARILLQYVQLRAACALMFVGIGLAGAQKVRVVALYADELTQRIGQVAREFDAGLRVREMKRGPAS